MDGLEIIVWVVVAAVGIVGEVSSLSRFGNDSSISVIPRAMLS